MKNYLVEIFDEDYLENIISIVHRKYDGIFLLCDRTQNVDNLSMFLQEHFNFKCKIEKYDMNDLKSIV